MEDNVGLEIRHQPEHAIAVADVGDAAVDHRPRLLGGKRFQHRMQRRLGILDDEQPRRAERDDAVANLGADRAAAAGHHHRFAVEEGFQPRVIDLHARPQQQILDIDRRQPRHFAGVIERRQPADRKPETARMHQGRFGFCIRLECRRREDHPRDRSVALRKVVDDGIERRKIAENGNAANRLALIASGLRQHADRPDFLDRAAFDGAQQHLGVGGTAEHERGIGGLRAGVMPGARVAEITIGQPRSAEEDELQDPIQDDGDLAEEELPEHVGRDQHVIEHQ